MSLRASLYFGVLVMLGLAAASGPLPPDARRGERAAELRPSVAAGAPASGEVADPARALRTALAQALASPIAGAMAMKPAAPPAAAVPAAPAQRTAMRLRPGLLVLGALFAAGLLAWRRRASTAG